MPDTTVSALPGALDDTQRDAAGAALLSAYGTREGIAPLSTTHPSMTIDDAYAIQARQIQAWTASGRRVEGYKIGLTSEAMQRQLGVDQPDYGFLVSGMIDRNDSVLDIDRYISPKVEPEIAFYLRKSLRGPGLTAEDVVDAVGTVVGSLEVIDSRIRDWKITLVDTIADNASSAGVVVGDVELPLVEVDVAALGVSLALDGAEVATGTGAAVMGSPINAVVWLANRLGELGVELHEGALVLPGSVCAAVPVTAGSQISVDFGPLGTVRTTFSTKEQQ